MQVLRDLRHETALQHAGRERNQVAPEQGRFLAWLLETLGARKVIEVGVFTGYSSLAMALVRACFTSETRRLGTFPAQAINPASCFDKGSALFQALPEDGCLVACEKDEGPLQLARDFWRRADIAHKVTGGERAHRRFKLSLLFRNMRKSHGA